MTTSENSPLLGSINPSEEPEIRYTDPDNTPHDPEAKPNGISDNSSQPAEEQDPDQPRIPGVSLGYVIPAIGIGIFLSAMDTTIVVASYPRIGTELDALDRTGWISTGYLLTSTAMQPLYGKLSDIFGRKSCLLFAYLIFGIGCLLCGISRTIFHLIVARAIAGIGGGGLTTIVSILLSDIVSLRKRGTWQGLLNIIFATGSAIGGPLGGYLTDTIGWRWGFLGQVPITILAVLVVILCLHVPHHEQKIATEGEESVVSEEALKDKLRRVDFLGAFVLVAAIFTLLLALDQGTSTVKLTLPWLLALSISSFILWCLFILIESSPSISKEPFCPTNLIKKRPTFAPCVSNFFGIMAVFVALFNFPLYCQAVLETSASTAGKRLLPAILGGVAGSLLGGVYMQKTGKYYALTAWSYLGLFLGNLLLSVIVSLPDLDATVKVYALGAAIGICCIGNGIAITSTLTALISNVAPKDQAVVTAVSYLFRSLGTVLGVSVSSGILQSGLGRRLHRRLDNGEYGTPEEVDEIIKGVRLGLDYLDGLEPGLAKLVRRCYGESLEEVFWFSAAMAFLAFLASLGLREVKVRRKS